MPELAERALDTAAQQGATYADVRLVRRRAQQVNVKSGHVQGVSLNETEGLGVRVLVDGAWGFASTSDLRGPEVDRVAALADAHRPRVGARVTRARPPRRAARGAGRVRDPASTRTRSRCRSTRPWRCSSPRTRRWARSRASRRRRPTTTRSANGRRSPRRSGSLTRQVITHVGASLEVNAASGDELQRRTYPESGGGYRAAGYEHVRGLGPRSSARAHSPRRPSSC